MTGSISGTFSVANSTLEAWVYVDGAVVAKSRQVVTFGGVTDYGQLTFTCLVSLAQDSYLEIFFDADSSGDLIIESANVNIMRVH